MFVVILMKHVLNYIVNRLELSLNEKVNIWNTDDEIKSTYGCSYIAIREKVSSDQEQVQSEPKDCPQKQKCEITKIT